LFSNGYICTKYIYRSKLSGQGWFGASDEAVRIWRWMTGPEAGTQFWQGAAGGIQLVVCIPTGLLANLTCGRRRLWSLLGYGGMIIQMLSVTQGMLWNTADLQMILAFLFQIQKQLL
jgi:hypothetical protein